MHKTVAAPMCIGAVPSVLSFSLNRQTGALIEQILAVSSSSANRFYFLQPR